MIKDSMVILTFKLQCSLQFETEVHLVNDLLSILEYYCGSATSVLICLKLSLLQWIDRSQKAATQTLVKRSVLLLSRQRRLFRLFGMHLNLYQAQINLPTSLVWVLKCAVQDLQSCSWTKYMYIPLKWIKVAIWFLLPILMWTLANSLELWPIP